MASWMKCKVVGRNDNLTPIVECSDCGQRFSNPKNASKYFRIYNSDFQVVGHILDHCPEGALSLYGGGFLAREMETKDHPLNFLSK